MLFLSLFFAITFFSIRDSLIARSEGEARDQLRSVLSELSMQSDSSDIEQIVSRHGVTGESRLVFVILEREHDSISIIYPSERKNNSAAIPRDVVRQMLEVSGKTISYSSNGSDFRLYPLVSGSYIGGVAMNMIFMEEAEESMVNAFAYSLVLGLFIAIVCGYLVANFTLSPLSVLVTAAR